MNKLNNLPQKATISRYAYKIISAKPRPTETDTTSITTLSTTHIMKK